MLRATLAHVRATTPTDVRFLALLVLAASLVVADPVSGPSRASAGRRFGALGRAAFANSAEITGDDGTVTPSLDDIDGFVAAALAQNKLPGCVVTIGRRDTILFQKAYGLREVEPQHVPMTVDTVFDLASLTKPVATATSIMILADQGKIGLDDPVGRYVPEFAKHGKAAITIRHLLTHVSGLPAETTLDDYRYGRAEAIRRISLLEPRAAPGVKFIYSDIGFIILEEVVARVSGHDLATFAASAIFRPLGMTETGFLPPPELRRRAAPTELRDGAWIVGEVHDPRAHRLGGISGNAGLFSTSADMSRYAQAMLMGGELGGVRILSGRMLRSMFAPHDVPGGIRALGWDVQTSYSINRGTTLSRRAVGHGGFTGTVLWIDPASDLFVLFLSNRVHPDGRGATNALAGQIGTLAGRLYGPAVEPDDAPIVGTGHVEVGIDVLRRQRFASLEGAHVALVTNVSGRASDGTRTVDLLEHAPGVRLVALFAPEHGLSANVDRKIENSVDEPTGLPVYSLYGNALAPTGATLDGVDTLVFDIQDAGARFFTYASTMHRTLRVAAERNVRVLVLDRPNPLGGLETAGPLPQGDELSFVNHHPLPIRHGLTFGELAEMINADEHLGLNLDVVRMRGWHRPLDFDQTGLTWTAPSPNLRSVDEAVLYPGVALVEGTNVSVGRGTDTPFEIVGAPWVDERLAEGLASATVPGTLIAGTTFTPTSGPFAGQVCKGVHLSVTDRAIFDPVRLGITLARSLRELYPAAWHADKLDEIIGNHKVTDAILSLLPLTDIEALWTADLEAFRARRKKYFLYPEEALSPESVPPTTSASLGAAK